MSTTFYDAMEAKGFSHATTASIRKFDCPNCGFRFSLAYARAIACRGCSKAVTGCNKVRCEKCDFEFPLNDTPDVENKLQERCLADHICNIVNNRYRGQGIEVFNR